MVYGSYWAHYSVLIIFISSSWHVNVFAMCIFMFVYEFLNKNQPVLHASKYYGAG